MNPALQRHKIGLDNPAFAGRLRADARSNAPSTGFGPRRPVSIQSNYVVVKNDSTVVHDHPVTPVNLAESKVAVKIVKPQPYAVPAAPKLQSSRVLHRRALQKPVAHISQAEPVKFESRRTVKKDNKRAQRALLAMAALVFTIGLGTAGQAYRTNVAAKRQVMALAASANKTKDPTKSGQSRTVTDAAAAQSDAPLPNVQKPSASNIADYTVVGDAPRYLDIPVLQVHSRVLPVGLLDNGALGTPNNIHDTNWYKASAKPGLPGATVIDGHVSSWSSHGVFYDLKKLVTGDDISVQRGDGLVIKYKVVKTVIYPASGVDMKAVLLPINPAKSGLNLISCTGTVKAGTSDFSKRIVIYTEQI